LPGITYRWYDADPGGTLVFTGNTFTSPPVTSFFTVYAEAINTQGCISQGRIDIDVNPMDVALAAFDYVVTPNNGQYEVTFNALSPEATAWLWVFGDTTGGINQSTNESTLFTYDTQGSYEVTLVTYNANGCTDTLKKVIFAGIKIPPFVPTTFTPNGDGRNDLFRVRSESWFLQEMRIYDQWGTLVYQTDSARPEWDGRINGKVVQNGTYVYRIRIADADNNTQDLTGPITVIK
jgi:gliding motility-associated-like protein